LAGLLGFQPLPASYVLGIIAIITGYFVIAEFTKRWFFHHF